MTKLFLTGDVMLGRGIDQILRHPSHPILYEDYIKSAQGYVRLAEAANGPIPHGVDLTYVWGDAAAVLTRARPDFGIVNLETAISKSGRPAPKGINYRMHPLNAADLPRLGIDCCVLANNHVLDWGKEGLVETLACFRELKIATAGAGEDAAAARAPAILSRDGKRRVLVFAFAAHDSGVPRHWSALDQRPGINFLDDFSAETASQIAALVAAHKKRNDIAIASLHWGGNWGYEVPSAHRSFAHALIDQAAIDIVHGHSSHHPKGWELYRNKLVLYGCGDFINDYEGIQGHERYRGDLALMYLPELDDRADGQLKALAIAPFKIANFRLGRVSHEDTQWLALLLNEQCLGGGRRLSVSPDGFLRL